MSRFSVNVSEFERSSLSDDQIRELFANIEKKIPKLNNISRRAIKYMLLGHVDYRLITIGKDYVIVIRKDKAASCSICIGYPFPIISKKTEVELFDGFSVNYYIRGNFLRNAQRAWLIHKLNKNNKTFDIKCLCTKYGLRNVLKRCLKNLKFDVLCYIDLYRFIGDSFLSTYMLDSFVSDFNIKNVIVLSKQNSKLNGFYKTMDLNDWNKVPDNGVYVFSDLLDIDDAFVHEFAINQPKNGIYILNGRNSFFVKNNDSVKYFTIKKHSDILLTYGNIFSYMSKCVSAFIKTKIHINMQKIKVKKIKRIYINPFSSSKQKSLSEQELFYLVNQLKTDFHNIDIIIPFGHNNETKKYSYKCSKKLNIDRLKDKGFYDLINKLLSNHIELIITTDTALTHVATKYNIKNIVMFKHGFWDKDSLQSLAAESPLSFISMNPCQLPVVLPVVNNKDFDKISDIIYLIQKTDNHGLGKIYNFCSKRFSLSENIGLLRLRWLLGIKHKLTYYKKGK